MMELICCSNLSWKICLLIHPSRDDWRTFRSLGVSFIEFIVLSRRNTWARSSGANRFNGFWYKSACESAGRVADLSPYRASSALTPHRRPPANRGLPGGSATPILYFRNVFEAEIPCSVYKSDYLFADGHTVSNAPDLFRPPKLSGTGPG